MEKPLNILITGATGMVGEGVLFECLQNPAVANILLVSRKHYEIQHPKVKELLVPDFAKLDQFAQALSGYDACFFCAGVSSLGMKEDNYRAITYDTTIAFAKALLEQNPGIRFTYVSGSHTDSTETGRIMWARVKGKTENDLAKLPFGAEYNFRPGAMYPFDGQKNWKSIYKVIVKLIRVFSAKSVISMHELGLAMIKAVSEGYEKNILEIKDIKALAAR